MDTCHLCEKQPATLVCACGQRHYCSPDCLGRDQHTRIPGQCDPAKKCLRLYTAILNAYLPVCDALVSDESLHPLAKKLRDAIVNRIVEMNHSEV